MNKLSLNDRSAGSGLDKATHRDNHRLKSDVPTCEYFVYNGKEPRRFDDIRHRAGNAGRQILLEPSIRVFIPRIRGWIARQRGVHPKSAEVAHQKACAGPARAGNGNMSKWCGRSIYGSKFMLSHLFCPSPDGSDNEGRELPRCLSHLMAGSLRGFLVVKQTPGAAPQAAVVVVHGAAIPAISSETIARNCRLKTSSVSLCSNVLRASMPILIRSSRRSYAACICPAKDVALSGSNTRQDFVVKHIENPYAIVQDGGFCKHGSLHDHQRTGIIS